jgi:hypothetical protein
MVPDERKRLLSIKSKVLAAAAVLTLAAGAGLAAAGTASAATPSCGHACIDIFSNQFGTHHDAAFVMDVFQQKRNVGQPVILFRQSNTDPAEDWTLAFQGTTADFFAAGLVSSAVALHYGCTTPTFPACVAPVDLNDPAFEVEYAPFGVDSGLCAGVAVTAVQGEGVTLQPCGVSAKTVWIVPLQTLAGFGSSYAPPINGSDTNFSEPFVLTYPANGFPTDKPRPQLQVDNLTGFAAFPFLDVNTNQLWGADFGTLP